MDNQFFKFVSYREKKIPRMRVENKDNIDFPLYSFEEELYFINMMQ